VQKGEPLWEASVAIGAGSGLLPDVPFGTFENASVLNNTIDAGPESSFSSTNGIGASLDFTIGIPCFLFCNIIIGVGGSYQNSNSAPQADLQDVNGDGYPDSVNSTRDGEWLVRANKPGRSNPLAQETNRLSGTI